MVEKIPYKETQISSGSVETVVRKFKSDLNSDELKWHWDEEDRIIHRVHETDWMVQLDNELPHHLEPITKIPKGVWHRLIKGSGDLELIIEKIKDI